MIEKPIRVLIVEDSDVVRRLLEHIINSDPRLVVVGVASDGIEALNALERLAPDVISMDIRMPRMDGFETTRRIMELRPTPIVVVSASVEADDLKISMNALRAGALTVVEKPAGVNNAAYETLAKRLCQQLVLMSTVKLIRQRGGLGERMPMPSRAVSAVAPRPTPPSAGYSVLGIVASTGGPNALAKLLCGLGADLPIPILIVQHMTASFMEGFASWLGSVTPMPVVLATDRCVPVPGAAYVAPADRHLGYDGLCLRLTDGPLISGQRPAGTFLFEALFASCGSRAIGVLLTGMGDDGARGLQMLRNAGGLTIVEHESTAVVYGMPAAAVALQAASHVLPLPEIAPRICEAISKARVRQS